jgi:hypothetical protein
MELLFCRGFQSRAERPYLSRIARVDSKPLTPHKKEKEEGDNGIDELQLKIQRLSVIRQIAFFCNRTTAHMLAYLPDRRTLNVPWMVRSTTVEPSLVGGSSPASNT